MRVPDRESMSTGKDVEVCRQSGERVLCRGVFAGADGQQRPVLAIVIAAEDPIPRALESRDNARRYLEAQMDLARANRVAIMGQLTATVAHEVNQPIAAAAANAQAAQRWLRARPPNINEVRRCLARIANDTTRASDVIARIHDLVKKAPPRREGLDINEVVREVIGLTRSEAVNAAISLQTELANDLPLIDGDRVQLQQVTLNLIVNAIQAMSAAEDVGRDLIVTTARTEQNEVVVAVKDTGPGLAPGSGEQMFDPFYSTKPQGLGMGLSICRSIIESHKGRFWATANQPYGTIFYFALPTERTASK